MKNLFLFLSFMMCCTPSWSQTTISGNLQNMEGYHPVLYLCAIKGYRDFFNGSSGLVIDSAKINEDGSFSFYQKNYAKGLYRLNIQETNSHSKGGMIMGRPDENYIHFYLTGGGEKINISAYAPELTWSYTIEANQASKNITLIRDLRSEMFPVLRSVWQRVQSSGNLTEAEFQEMQESAMEEMMVSAREMQKKLQPFMDTTTDVTTGLLATAYYNLDDDYANYIGYFDSLIQKWQQTDPKNPYLKGLIQEILDYKSIPIGSIPPEIILPSLSGESLKLSEIKGKLILIDFWASWCTPCRIENRGTVLPLYQKYHSKGFEVFGVSFDTDMKKWVTAIEKDQYPWIHVIESKGLGKSPIDQDYKISGVPTTYLLNEKGVVIAKDLHNADLIKFVNDFFKD